MVCNNDLPIHQPNVHVEQENPVESMCKYVCCGGGERLAHISDHLKTPHEKLEEEANSRVPGVKHYHTQGAKIMLCGLGAISACDGLLGGLEQKDNKAVWKKQELADV